MLAPIWTDDKIDQLRRLIGSPENYTARQIAERIGVSRNSVIGKAKRLGIELPNKVTRAPRVPGMPTGSIASKILHGIKRQRREAANPKIKAEPFLCQGAADIEPLNIDIMALTAATCKWPYGDNPPFVFCGHPVSAGSYCQGHHRISVGEGTPSERAASQVSRMVA